VLLHFYVYACVHILFITHAQTYSLKQIIGTYVMIHSAHLFFTIACDLPEYKVLTAYYNKLVDTICACDLSHYFVSENVISLTDHQEITKPTTISRTASQLLLNKVLYMLREYSSVECFNRMLTIMDTHGDSATHTLSQEIRAKLYHSSQQGKHRHC